VNVEAVLQSLHRGAVLAAPVPPRNTANLAWVGVYLLDPSKPTTAEFLRREGLAVLPSVGRSYHIRRFEVERRLIEEDACIAEAEMTEKESLLAFGDDDLRMKLARLGVGVEQLDLPHKSDYPI
jgi:hypothetical protein